VVQQFLGLNACGKAQGLIRWIEMEEVNLAVNCPGTSVWSFSEQTPPASL